MFSKQVLCYVAYFLEEAKKCPACFQAVRPTFSWAHTSKRSGI